MELWNDNLLGLYVELRKEELHRKARQPVPPAAPSLWTVLRRRLARRLVGLGLRLDADASRAAIRSREAAPRLNGSDA